MNLYKWTLATCAVTAFAYYVITWDTGTPVRKGNVEPVTAAAETDDFLKTASYLLKRPLDAACAMSLQKWMEDANDARTRGKVHHTSESVRACLGGHYANIMPKEPSERVGPSLVSTFKADYGYVTWDEFNRASGDRHVGTALELAAAVRGTGVRHLIIDLRLNRGGAAQEALDIINHFANGPFTPTITEVSVRGETKLFWTVPSALARELRETFVIIMVSRITCSAAEMLAGVLRRQHPGRVVLVGEKTCGKNVYQVALAVGDYIVSAHGGEWFIGHGASRRSVKGGMSPDWVTNDVWKVAFALINLRKGLEAEARTLRQASGVSIDPKTVSTSRCEMWGWIPICQ